MEPPLLVSHPSLNEALFSAVSKVLENIPQSSDLPAVWHYAALLSLTGEDRVKRERMQDKWVPESKLEDLIEIACSVLNSLFSNPSLPPEFSEKMSIVDPEEYARMILAWRYNSFGHHTDASALCMYDITSTMAHSCLPSAVWHFGSDDAFCLRARVSLKPGDEITISYLGDEDLLRSVPERRKRTQGWLFSCHCDRCQSPIDFSRAFRCPTCFIGAIYMHPKNIPVGPCTCCNATLNTEMCERFLELESAYASRLQQTDSTDYDDVQAVLVDARNLFHENHWIIYSLETLVCEYLKKTKTNTPARLMYLSSKLQFLNQTFPIANYTSAWILEELGDCYADLNMTNEAALKYTTSYWCMQILCGSQHPFSESISAKWAEIEDEKETTKPPVEEPETTSTTPSRASPPTVI